MHELPVVIMLMSGKVMVWRHTNETVASQACLQALLGRHGGTKMQLWLLSVNRQCQSMWLKVLSYLVRAPGLSSEQMSVLISNGMYAPGTALSTSHCGPTVLVN